MGFWEGFWLITGVHLLAAATPGADFLMASQHTLRYGKKAGLWCVSGIALALGIHIAYSIAGLAVVIANSAHILWGIKILGAMYLSYLGWQGLRSHYTGAVSLDDKKEAKISARKSFSMGFMCNLFNPKAPIYFIALFTSVISPLLPTYQLVIYGIWMVILQWLWFAFVVFMLSVPKINRQFQKFSYWLDRIFGLVLIMLAIKILLF